MRPSGVPYDPVTRQIVSPLNYKRVGDDKVALARGPAHDREQARDRYRAYREAATVAVATNQFPETPDGLRVHVDTYAGVQSTEDGAFVEARVWVPARVLKEV